MIGSLMRRDSALRPAWGGLLLGLVSVQAGFIVGGTASRGSAPGPAPAEVLWLALSMLWVPLAIFQIVAGLTRRSTPMDLGLPIPGRVLWGAHLMTHLAASVGLAALVVLIDAAGALLRAWVHGGEMVGPVTLDVLPHALAWYVLIAVAISGIGLDRVRIGFSWGYLGLSLALLLGGVAASWITLRVSPALALAPLVTAAGLALLWLRRVPPTLTTVSRHPARTQSRAAAPTLPSSQSRVAERGFVLRTIWLSLFGRGLPWVLLLPVALYGWICSGFLDEGESGGYSGLAFGLMTTYVLVVATLPGLRRLPMLDAVPIRRRTIFAVMALPALMVFLAGYGIGRITAASLIEPHESIAYTADSQGLYDLKVPLDRFAIAWNGRPPDVTAPWGESHPPRTLIVFPGLPVVLYKPYTAPPGSSIDFVALQISRAVKAEYGRTLPPEVICAKYLALNEDGRVEPVQGKLRLQAEEPGLKPRGHEPHAAVVLVGVGVPYLLLLAVTLRWLRQRSSEGAYRMAIWGMLAVTAVPQLIYLGGGIAQLWDFSVHASLLSIVVRGACAAIPGGEGFFWASGLLLLWGAYKVAEKQFQALEAAPRPQMACKWWRAGGA